MSEEEFLNRILNKIAKEFGYDVASTLELMFMTKRKKIEQLENIRKEAVEYIKGWQSFPHTNCTTHNELKNLLNILNKGDNNEKNE